MSAPPTGLVLSPAQALDRAVALYVAGNTREAEALSRLIVQAQPGHLVALRLLGVLQYQRGAFDEAEQSLRRALALAPDASECHGNLSAVLSALGRHDEALQSADRALAGAPDDAAAWGNRGLALRGLERPQESLESYRRAQALKPDLSDFHFGQGAALTLLQRFDEAMSSFERAIALDPRNASACSAYANLLRLEGRYEEALRACNQAVALRPDDPALLLRCAQIQPIIASSREQIVQARERLAGGLTALAGSGQKIADPLVHLGGGNFFLAYQACNDRELQSVFAATLLELCPQLAPPAPPRPEVSGRRLRIGVISGSLKEHTIGKLTLGIIEELDRSRFEVVVLRLERADDDFGRTIDAAADTVVQVPLQLDAAREQIAALSLDVLFYTDIGLDAFTYFLAFARLAPVQAVTWGHPVTTGIPAIDYFVSSALLEPEGAADHYSEQLIRLQGLPVCYRRWPRPPRAARADFGLPDDARLYVCPQSLFKIHPDFDHILGQILSKDPKAWIVFVAGRRAHWEKLLRDRLSAAIGDSAERVIFLPRMPHGRFLQLLDLADVLLDPIHFGGGNSTYEALSFGVPVVTWPGAFMRGRVTSACYQAMGMDDLIATDAPGYVALALKLAQDRPWRTLMSEKIQARSHVLFDNLAAVRELEAFFEAATTAAASGERVSSWQ